jgi:hypothetical protein
MTEAGAHHQGDGDERQDDHGKKMSCCTTQATAGQEDAMLWFGLWVCRVYLPIIWYDRGKSLLLYQINIII